MVELTKTFELDCDVLDQDHKQLVEMVNEIIAMLDNGETGKCRDKVAEFASFTKGHFGREENYLAKSGYPDIEKHRQHHRYLMEKIDHMVEFASAADDNEIACESLKKELVFFVMDDVITSDLDFKSYVSDNPAD